VIYVQPEANGAPADDGHGEGAGGDTSGSGEDARADEAAIVAVMTKTVMTDAAGASHEPEIPNQTKV
jgi:hypothetical protein